MIRRLDLPDRCGPADPSGDPRRHAPSAERNAGPIADALATLAPDSGRALEIASGTGQHVAALARRRPGLHWQPTEADAAMLPSIAAWTDGLANVAAPLTLDATAAGWSHDHPAQDLILLVNLLHLIGAAEAETLVREAAAALAPGGCFVVYGPFMRGGALTSEGDRAFHANLVAQDPAIGYKDAEEVAATARAAGLAADPPREMPANNLMLTFRKA